MKTGLIRKNTAKSKGIIKFEVDTPMELNYNCYNKTRKGVLL